MPPTKSIPTYLHFLYLFRALCCFATLTFSSFIDYIYYSDNNIKRGYSVAVVETEDSSGGTSEKIIEIGVSWLNVRTC